MPDPRATGTTPPPYPNPPAVPGDQPSSAPGASVRTAPPATDAVTRSPAEASAGSAEPDWKDQVTDLIVDSVDKVRDRTTGPILEGAKGLVYAVVALILLVPVTVAVLAGSVRLLNYALPGGVWAAYTVLSAVFLLLGAVLWRRRGRAPT